MSPAADKPRLFAWNLIAILMTGVLLSFWMLYYTDYFPVFGGLLGLTGVFAWVAFIAGVLTDERKSSLQKWFDNSVLQSNVPWLVCVIGLGLFAILVVARMGTVVIDTTGDDMARLVSITEAAADPEKADPVHLSPQSEQQRLVATGWLRPAKYRVRASGLPDVLVDVSPGQRFPVSIPNSALSVPVILVRPDPRLGAAAAGGDFKLTVTRNGQPFGELANFKGNSAWIGARRDVTVPQRLVDRWRLEPIPEGGVDQVISRWRWPVALPEGPTLSFGDRLRVSIVSRANAVNAHSVCPNVTHPPTVADFPQEVIIHVGDNC